MAQLSYILKKIKINLIFCITIRFADKEWSQANYYQFTKKIFICSVTIILIFFLWKYNFYILNTFQSIYLHMIIINTLFLLVVLTKTQTNLICNGDFQEYVTSTLSNGSLNNAEYSGYIETNASCWIRNSLAAAGSLTTSIQVKLITTPVWPANSKGVDTVSYDRYGICQNLTLIKGSKYTLKYNLVLDASILNTTFTTYVNSVPIVTKIYNKTYTVYTETFNFTANASSNLLCLQPDLINYNSSFSSLFPSYRYGPVIDNISLQLSSQLINSTINSTTNSTNSTTNLISNSTMNPSANSTVNSTNSTIVASNSTINSNTNSTSNSSSNSTSNSSYNSNMNFSTNSTTNLTGNSNSTLNFTNSSANVSIIQNVTNNSSVNQSTQNSPSNITSNSTTNVTSGNISSENSSSPAQNMSVNTQNVTSSNSSLNTSPTDNSSSINNTVISINNMTSNTSFNSSSNSSENSTTPNTTIPIPPPNIPTLKSTDKIVHFKSEISSLSENIALVSDLKPSLFGIPMRLFSLLRVQIQQTVQNSIVYYTDPNGLLCVQFLPESYYNSDIISSTLKIYIPQILFQLVSYKFTVIVDGKTINLVTLTQKQKNMMESAITTMQNISKIIQKSFLVINSVSCSYFLISLLGFYNLSLMYIFLKLNALPNFSRVFLNTLAYVFFSKGSVTEFIKEIFKIQQQINLFDFPIEEKMQSHQNQFIWFGAFGNSSNFMLNNFESLVLLGLLLIKFLILKLILIKLLPEKLKQQLDVKPSKFYQHFLGELSCFVPFFVVSSTECILEMGESNWCGQLNNLTQIFVFFLFSIMTIIGFSLTYMKANRKLSSLNRCQKSMKNQKWIASRQKYKQRKCIILQKHSYFLLCFLMPFVVIIGNNIMFFILVSPIIVWRFYSSIMIVHRKKSLQNICKLMNKIVWMVYHFGFLLLFVLQLLQIVASKSMLDFMKYIGFILIFCVLIGAFIDILQALISVIMAIVKFIKICVKSCKNQVAACSQKSDRNRKETQQAQATQKDIQKVRSQKIGQAQCLKLKIEQIQTQQNEVNKKKKGSLAQLSKIVKIKTTKIKNASTNRQITDKRLKIKQLQ